MAGQLFDVAIIGGGMHGAWIALRAARAGLSVALLERDDFAAGTSANSLKILHGGLRYLQKLDFPRMRRSICARRAYARWSPHLFEALPCVMPLNATGMRSPWFVGPALLFNDLIGLDRNAGVSDAARLPTGGLLSGAQLKDEIKGLATRPAFAGALWWDAIARDPERLVLETLLEAADAGAQVLNHAQVERILHADGRVHGVALADRLTGRTHELHARNVVNAAGPWAAALARASGLSDAHLPHAWTGAMNVVLRRSLGHRAAIALSTSQRSTGGDPVASRNRDRGLRELFFVPWRGHTMIGTDYLPVGDVAEGLRGPTPAAVHRFLEQAAALAPAARIEPADLALVHWGLLPLQRAGDALPGKTPVILDDAAQTGAEGALAVIGEKLTSAPQLSARVVARLQRRLGGGQSTTRRAGRRARARRVQDVAGSSAAAAAGASVSSQPAEQLVSRNDLPDDRVRVRLERYGPRWTELVELGTQHSGDFLPVAADSPVLCVELRHAIEREMACTLPDLLRRVGAGQTGHPGAGFVGACAAWAQRHCGWDAQRLHTQVQELDAWFRSRAPTLQPM